MRVLVDPQSRFDGATAIARGDIPVRGRCKHSGGEFRREHHAGFIDADVALLLHCSLGKLANKDQRGERRHGAGAPSFSHAERVDEVRRKLKRQTFIATNVMLMRAGIFIAGMADQDRAGDEFIVPALRAAAEASPAHVSEREAPMHLGEWRIRGTKRAAIIDDGNVGGTKDLRSLDHQLACRSESNRFGAPRACTLSIASNLRFKAMPVGAEKPPILPPAASTRWHGTMIG
jgi:hypothetical protein